MIFPHTKGVKGGKAAPVLIAYYKCDIGQACDFSQVFTALKNSQDMTAWGMEPMLSEIITAISTHPADYKPGLFDGFLVNRDGQGMLLMKRQGADDSGRTGFIEYNNYRHEMIEEARTQRIVATIKASYTMGRANRCVVC
jgi:hypothetical protein